MRQMVILDELNPSVTSVIEAIDIVSAGNQMLRDFLDLVRKARVKRQLVYYDQDTARMCLDFTTEKPVEPLRGTTIGWGATVYCGPVPHEQTHQTIVLYKA
jgi:hypothetical protein|nr:MAG TPA: hypothetical protein [Crassvirales sp.]